MAEQSNDKYIKCSCCKCKFINNDEHIKAEFGYNRLNERFKTCFKCREKGREYSHRYANSEHGNAVRAAYYEGKGRQYNFEKLTCNTCGAQVCRNSMRKHETQAGCSTNDLKTNN